jgi:hypothetical protein
MDDVARIASDRHDDRVHGSDDLIARSRLGGATMAALDPVARGTLSGVTILSGRLSENGDIHESPAPWDTDDPFHNARLCCGRGDIL